MGNSSMGQPRPKGSVTGSHAKLKEELEHAEEYLGRSKKLTLEEQRQLLCHLEECQEHLNEMVIELEDSIEAQEEAEALADSEDDN